MVCLNQSINGMLVAVLFVLLVTLKCQRVRGDNILYDGIACHVCNDDPYATMNNPDNEANLYSILSNFRIDVNVTCEEVLRFGAGAKFVREECALLLANTAFQTTCGCTSALRTHTVVRSTRRLLASSLNPSSILGTSSDSPTPLLGVTSDFPTASLPAYNSDLPTPSVPTYNSDIPTHSSDFPSSSSDLPTSSSDSPTSSSDSPTSSSDSPTSSSDSPTSSSDSPTSSSDSPTSIDDADDYDADDYYADDYDYDDYDYDDYDADDDDAGKTDDAIRVLAALRGSDIAMTTNSPPDNEDDRDNKADGGRSRSVKHALLRNSNSNILPKSVVPASPSTPAKSLKGIKGMKSIRVSTVRVGMMNGKDHDKMKGVTMVGNEGDNVDEFVAAEDDDTGMTDDLKSFETFRLLAALRGVDHGLVTVPQTGDRNMLA